MCNSFSYPNNKRKSWGDRGEVKQQVEVLQAVVVSNLHVGGLEKILTLTGSDDVKESFYEELNALVKITLPGDRLLLGDLSTRVGSDCGNRKGVLGLHCSGKMNYNGLMLLNETSETSRSPEPCGDHRLVRSILSLHIVPNQQKSPKQTRVAFKTEKLKNPLYREQFCVDLGLDQNLTTLGHLTGDETQQWEQFNTRVKETAQSLPANDTLLILKERSVTNERWRGHFNTLFNRPPSVRNNALIQIPIGSLDLPTPLVEVKKAIRHTSLGKALGMYWIPASSSTA
ncbi:hypothetical protein RRG08_026585 [Elysia crispata]|uniref:Uncharacterized protein n=1 Tax=Elysia crispata TaxID=231223 RepID=A0AAE0Y4F8_9GAST|nr:hypothetical protein RRG08_026585 [Elysia crispata]